MGTPEFAIPSLARLVESHHDVVAVVTGCDKPVGRGQRMCETPIKKFAVENNIPVVTPESLKSTEFAQELAEFDADLFVVVAFRILPRAVFTIPPKGTINLHGSILPKYRGAAPIQWAIINGDTETGVTTFFIDEKVDTGNIIQTRTMPIGPDDTAGDIHDRMAVMGAVVLANTVDLIAYDKAPRLPQDGEVTKAPKITRDICCIDWEKSATDIKNLIRGLSPFPGAFTTYQGSQFKVCCAQIASLDKELKAVPGEIVAVDKIGEIIVATGNGYIAIRELQPASKRRMSVAEYLRGHGVELGTVLGA
jgi:methionyl-tRNA formyltransferase